MYIEELLILIVIAFAILAYRNYKGQNVGKFITVQVQQMYDRFAPYSFKVVREKTKELGQEYTAKQYALQVIGMSVFAGAVTYLYFYNLVICIFYILIVIMFVPYLSYLRCKRVYSEFIFEQIQVYTSNVIMEFATTQSFVKSLEGVRNSGILEDPVKSDVDYMIELAYKNGSIDESLAYMSRTYPYYIVKNMHQLFLQITKEGARNSADSLDNMQLDIDMLVESVYRDRMDRSNFHKKFIQFGLVLYGMVMLVQLLLGTEKYMTMIADWKMQLLIHLIVALNTYFLISGEKYYNEDVGAE